MSPHRLNDLLSSKAADRAAELTKRRQKSGGHSRLTVKFGQVAPLAILLLLFLLAFAMRAWGTRFGLPEYVYHPDEHAIVERAATILRTGDYSPHWFNYPTAYIYIQALTYIPYFLISAARGFGDTIPSTAPYGFYFAGRLMTALIGALTVPLVYVLGKRMFDRRIGLVASLMLSFSLLHTVHSHYVTTDVPMAFFVTLSLLFCHMSMDKVGLKYAVLAGLFAGLATSTKYPGLVAVLPLLLVQVLTARWGEWSSLRQRLGVSLGAFVGGFLVGTPYALLELNTFLNSLASVLSHYSASQPGFEGSASGIWYVGQMLRSADVVMAAIGLGGIVWALVRHTRRDLLLLSFVIPYYLLLSVWRIRFERHLVALLPFLAILAGRFLVEGISWLVTKWSAARKGEVPLLACVTALAIAMPARGILDFDRALAQRDHRTFAAEWVNAHVPAGSKIVTEAFSIPLDEDRFQVLPLVRIDSRDPDWYRREGIEYI
ncbi:MAG: hypothetical protein CEE40_11845, partial [Chloroflexi bacterium B3_Chlor]